MSQAKLQTFSESTENAGPRRDYTDPRDGLITETVGRRYTDEGVKLLKENNAGGVWSCSWKIIEWGTADDIKQCPGCNSFHLAADPELCFTCATGGN